MNLGDEMGYDIGTETETKSDDEGDTYNNNGGEGGNMDMGYDEESSTEVEGDNTGVTHDKRENGVNIGIKYGANLGVCGAEVTAAVRAANGEALQQTAPRGKRRGTRTTEGKREAARLEASPVRWEARRRQSLGAAGGTYWRGNSTGAERGVERGGVKYTVRVAGREREDKGDKELVTGKGRNKGERENYDEWVAGWDRRNKEKNDWLFKLDFIDVIDLEGGLDLVYFNENRKREGELDGNTVYWEYKKG
jgi:hypothetical protein